MNETTKTATETTTARGFPGLRCPGCGEEDVMSVHLAEVTTFRCTNESCECEYTTEELETLVATWRRVLDWVKLTPALPTE